MENNKTLKETPCPTCGTKCVADRNNSGHYEYLPVYESQDKIDSDHILIKQLEKEIRELMEETDRRRVLYEIANEHRIAMADEIQDLKCVNKIEVEANEKIRKAHHELNKDNMRLKFLLRKVFEEAIPSKSDLGTDLYNEIKAVL